MKLKHLEYFQAVCKYNNLTRAAGELHISQPSLSAVIKELETEFGVPLFYRQSKGLVPTSQGEVLLEETQLLLRQMEHLFSRMDSLRAEKPIVRLGIPPMLGLLIFPHLFQVFHQHFPDIHLEVVENGSLINQNMIREGKLDAALVATDQELPPDFQSRVLDQIHVNLYVSSGHPLALRDMLSLTDVGNTPLALQAEGSFVTDFIKRYFAKNGLVPNIMVQTNQLATIQQLIRNQTAASFLFDGILPETQEIRRIPVREFPPVQAMLIWNKNLEPSPATQKLIHLSPFYSSDGENANTKV